MLREGGDEDDDEGSDDEGEEEAVALPVDQSTRSSRRKVTVKR